MKRRVLALLRGLVDVRELQGPRKDCNTSNHHLFLRRASITATYGDSEDSEDSEDYGTERVMQFIHQSVKEFLLEEGLQLLGKGPIHNAIGRGHSCLSRSCIKYLSMEDVPHCVYTVPPFLSYAARCWHLHLEEAEKRDPPQAGLLSMLCMSWDRFMQTWIRVSGELRYCDTDAPRANWSLLHVASRYNLPSVVSATRERGVEANSRLQGGRTPLSIAAEADSEEVVKVLLARHDVEQDTQDEYGPTPLFYAVLLWRKAILTLLLDQESVDPNVQDRFGDTPLSEAIEPGYADIGTILLQQSDVDADHRDSFGATPLLWARENIVKRLLDRNDVDPNSTDRLGRTPLSYAADRGQKAIVELLLDRNDVNPNVQDLNGSTPLARAAGRDRKNRTALTRSK